MAKALRALGLSRMERWAYAGGLTDESFAFHSVKLGTDAQSASVPDRFNLFCHTSWVLGGLLNARLPRAICIAPDQISARLRTDRDDALRARVSLCNTRNKLIATAAAAVVCMGA